jgi:subtilisin family serine protease
MASSGNDNKNVDAQDCFIVCWEEKWWTPCENAGVFCVGALGHDSIGRADYSNYGKAGGGVDLFAPGTVLVGFDPATTTGLPGRFPVHSVQGTSFASPYLAGVAALVRAADPGLSAGSVESILKSTATRGLRSTSRRSSTTTAWAR